MPDDDEVTLDVKKVGEGSGPMPQEFDLLKHGLDHARECLESLKEPDDDILPVLMWIGPYGMGVMPMLDMADDDAKDALAEMMTTSLACSRATEALMITCSWMVTAKSKDGDPTILNVMPSQHPDRVECITAMHMTGDKKHESMSSAVITRYPDKPPELGEWDTNLSDDDEFQIGGRFGDAIHMGFTFVNGMPPPLVEILDEGWALGEQEQLIKRFHRVFHGFLAAADEFRAGAEEAKDNLDVTRQARGYMPPKEQESKLEPEDDVARANADRDFTQPGTVMGADGVERPYTPPEGMGDDATRGE